MSNQEKRVSTSLKMDISNSSVTSTSSTESKPGSRSSLPKARSRPKFSPTTDVDDEGMAQVALWLDGLPLSRSRSEVSLGRVERDYSDGYLVAEALAQHHPSIIHMHNYSRGCSTSAKRHNWHHLRNKVLVKLGLGITNEHIESIIVGKPGAINKVLKGIHDLAMSLEAQKREAEEERARASADPLPLDDWKQDICFVRNDPKGQKEFMIQGKVMVQKDLMVQEVEIRDLELTQLKSTNQQLKAQVARLQMTVDLKEDRLAELTHSLSLVQRQEQQKVSPPPGPDGDNDKRKFYRNIFPKI